MKKSNLICLLSILLSSVSFASACDHAQIRVVGPSHYSYTIFLSEGTIDKKTTGEHLLQDITASPDGQSHYLYSGKGTRGDIRGSISFIDLTTQKTVHIPFNFYEKHILSCLTNPGVEDVETDESHQVQIKSNEFQKDAGLNFTLREFK